MSSFPKGDEGDFVFGVVFAAILWDIYSVRQSAADARAYAVWTMLLLSAVVLVASPPRSH
jgi:hypothetical protein